MADYKINHMTGRLYKFFTGTPSSYYDYLVNRIMDVHEDSAFNDQKAIFYARVVSDTSNVAPTTSTKESKGAASWFSSIIDFGGGEGEESSEFYKLAIKFRFAGEDEARNQIPDPLTVPPSEKAMIISLHSYAILDLDTARKIGGIEGLTENSLITVREEEGVYYVTGKMDETFDPSGIQVQQGVKENFSIRRPSPLSSFIDPRCQQAVVVTDGSCYNHDQTKIKTGDKTTNTKFLLKWDDYKKLAPHFTTIRDYIAKHESGAKGYEANNLGDTRLNIDPVKALGKRLRDMTLKELRANMNDSGGILFATGRYQIVPTTLRDAMASLNLPDSTVYNEETQDALCVYLAITKRPNLGKYLLSKNNDLIRAGNDLSFEWAFAPLLGPYSISGKTYQRGQSIYAGKAGNKTNTKYVETMTKALENQKSEFFTAWFSSPELQAIVEKYGK